MTTNDNGLGDLTISFNGTNIPQIESIEMEGFEQEFYRATYIGDATERCSPTTMKAQKITIVCGYDPNQHNFLLVAMRAKPKTKGTIVIHIGESPDGNVPAEDFTCEIGWVGGFKPMLGDAKAQSKVQIVIQSSGDWS